MTEEKSDISLSLPSEMIAQIDLVAASLRQDRNWVIEHALDAFLAGEGADMLDDAAGLAELDQGRSSDLGDVLRKASVIVEKAEALKARRAG